MYAIRSCVTTAAVIVLTAACVSVATAVRAQEYPSRNLRMVAAMPAGGSGDLNARRLAERLSKLLRHSIVVENIAGAAGNSAAVTVAGSSPDGHTLFFASHPILAVNPVLYERLPFNADRDFTAVALVSQTPHVLLVNAALPAQRIAELVSLAKAKPGTLHFGSGGSGTSIHLAGELLKTVAAVDLVHVPYRGAAPAVTALIGNEIQMLFDSTITGIGHIRGGRVRGLAIASLQRSTALPELPTFDESGVPGFETGVAHGVLVSAAVPAPIVATLNRAINAALDDADYRRQMGELGVVIAGGTPEQFRAYIAVERRKWGDLIRRQGIRVN